MRLPLHLLVAAAAGATASGCGDNEPLPGDPFVDPEGPYTHPADFPRESCAPGAFAGADAVGIYHVRLDFGGGFSRAIAIRVDPEGGVLWGEEADVVARYGDDDLVLQVAEGGDVTALDLCGQEDGLLAGTFVSCSEGQDPECGEVPVRGKKLERLAEPGATGMTLLGQAGAGWRNAGGMAANVRVSDGIAYVATYGDGLRIVDVHDPANPVELGHLRPESEDWEIYNDVKLVGGYALLASSTRGVVVVNVANPSAPFIAGHIASPTPPGEGRNTHTLFVDGDRAYTATRDEGLAIWDITQPTSAVRLSTFMPAPGDAYLHDLFVSGDRVYANFWDLGMVVVDVSDPAQPEEVGRFDDYGEYSSHSSWVTRIGDRDIAVHGDEQWNAHVHIVDVTEGTSAFATSLAEWQTRPEVSVHNVMAFGDRAFIAHYQDGVRVLDLSDPEAPVEVAHYATHPGYDVRYGFNFFEGVLGIDVDVANRIVYVADSHRGLLILRLDA